MKDKYAKLEQQNKGLKIDIEGIKAKNESDLINIKRSKETEIKNINSELDKERQRVNDM